VGGIDSCELTADLGKPHANDAIEAPQSSKIAASMLAVETRPL
jgi:hypothetical protein